MSSSESSSESKKLRFYAAGQIIPSEKVYIVYLVKRIEWRI